MKNAIYTPEAERQRKIRIRLSIAAYAYEFESTSIMSDAEFDAMSLEVKPEVDTGHPVMDQFFRTEFNPSTGMWVRSHPKLDKLRRLYHWIEHLKKDPKNKRRKSR